MPLNFASRLSNPASVPLVVAELSGNHNGDRDRFLGLIRAASTAGADAVKFQTYTADTITLPVRTERFRISGDHPLWGGETLYDLYEKSHTPWEWHADGFALARELGMAAFSSPFDSTAVDFLEQFDPPCHKIASMEIVDIPLIRYAASTGRPLVISIGTASLAEVATAVEAARAGGANEVVLLQCTSSYPADPVDANLRTIPALRNALGVELGLSDHTLGIGVSVAAVALGARVIEKHFTLDRTDGGVDAAFSLTPSELAMLVTEVRTAHVALGSTRSMALPAEAESLRLRRSLYVVQDVTAGEYVAPTTVRSVRPSGGLPPIALESLIGRRFVADVLAGTPMSWDLVAPRDS
jgi:N-acetylneuraminate synthase